MHQAMCRYVLHRIHGNVTPLLRSYIHLYRCIYNAGVSFALCVCCVCNVGMLLHCHSLQREALGQASEGRVGRNEDVLETKQGS